MLLDESLPKNLKHLLKDIVEVKTVSEMKWNSKVNGELLSLASSNEFSYFVIVDKNLVNQQNLSKYNIQVILLNSFSNRYQVLEPYILK